MANIVSNSIKYFTHDGVTIKDFDLQKEFDKTIGYRTGVIYNNKIDKEINFTTRWSPVQESKIYDFFKDRNQIIRKIYFRYVGHTLLLY